MNIPNCIKAIKILEKNRDRISNIYHDESFLIRNPRNRKGTFAWICYELDTRNYPKEIGGLSFYDINKRIVELLDIDFYTFDLLYSEGSNVDNLISTIKELVIKEISMEELMRLIGELDL